MLIIELSRRYINRCYNGDFCAAINERDGVIFTEERIKRFNYGNYTIDDFKRYMNDNKTFCRYYDLEKHVFIN